MRVSLPIIIIVLIIAVGVVGTVVLGIRAQRRLSLVQTSPSPSLARMIPSSAATTTSQPSNSSSPTATSTPDLAADWKLYENRTLGLSFRYPPSFSLKGESIKTEETLEPGVPDFKIEFASKNGDSFVISNAPVGFETDRESGVPEKVNQLSSGEKVVRNVTVPEDGPSKYRIIASTFEVQNPKNRFWFLTSDFDQKDSSVKIATFDQILATFKFNG